MASEILERAHEFAAYAKCGFTAMEIAEMFGYPTAEVDLLLCNPGLRLVQ